MIGNSNDGNLARKCFSKPATFARIVGAPVKLVRILTTLLNAINTTRPLDADKFQKKANEFLTDFHKSNISWNTLNPSLHALLVHGGDMIRYFRGSIGLFSEEGPECNNKIIRHVKNNSFIMHPPLIF